MEFSTYLQLFRRWAWLIVLAMLLAGGASYLTTRAQVPLFQTSALVQIGSVQQELNPDRGTINAAADLADTYFVLAGTRPVLDSVAAKLSFSISSTDLLLSFKTALIPNTPFFTITVTNTNAKHAAEIANVLAQELVDQSPARLSAIRQKQVTDLQAEIQQLTAQLEKDRSELRAIEDQLKVAPDTAILTSRQNELVTRIATQQSTYSQLSSNLTAMQGRGDINVLSIKDPALEPERPISSSIARDVLLAVFIGAVVAVIIIALLEQLNTTIKSPSELSRLRSVPIVGVIPTFGRKYNRQKLIVWIDRNSVIAEAYRALRVNVQYIGGPESESSLLSTQRIFALTSCETKAGTSVTSANLAIAFAAAGFNVTLIDANFRAPALHRLFTLQNPRGLSDVLDVDKQMVVASAEDARPALLKRGVTKPLRPLTPSGEDARAGTTHRPLMYSDLPIQPTSIPRLSIMTTGTLPADPTNLLDSPRLSEITRMLVGGEQSIVIFDTPPLLQATDSAVIANATNAEVILVVEAKHTRRGAAVAALDRLSLLSIRIAGVVFNRTEQRPEDQTTSLGIPQSGPVTMSISGSGSLKS